MSVHGEDVPVVFKFDLSKAVLRDMTFRQNEYVVDLYFKMGEVVYTVSVAGFDLDQISKVMQRKR
jgi:hypothetical protein